ncbi:MAG: energy transducer TonB [Methylocystaceae bacterium]|nr:energy transducer TonB [Methylocystaceae bacterium]
MRSSDHYRIDETTGQVVVDSPLGGRLLPVFSAVFIHVAVFLSLFAVDFEGDAAAVQQEKVFEVAVVMDAVEPPAVVEAPIVEQEVEEEAEPIEEVVEEPEPIEPEAEIIEQKEPEKTVVLPVVLKPRVAASVTPLKKPEIQPKPVNVQTMPQKHQVVQVQRRPKKIGFIKPVYPAYLKNPPPPYPKKAKSRRQEGIVELRVWVSEKGSVLRLQLFKTSGHPMLDRAALTTVEKWRFLPAKRNGVAVQSEVIVPIRFNLKS